MRSVVFVVIVFIFGLIFGYKGSELINGRKSLSTKVLSESVSNNNLTNDDPIITIIPTLIPSSTPTLVPVPTNTPIPAKIPTPPPLPTIAPQKVHEFVERFSIQYGVDANIMRHIAVCESGFNPYVINGKYAGLYQFSEITWRNNRSIMGENTDPNLRLDAEESAQTAAFMVSIGRGDIWPNCFP